MSDAVLITTTAMVVALVIRAISRWWSHREHKQTEARVKDTNQKVTAMVNGKY